MLYNVVLPARDLFEDTVVIREAFARLVDGYHADGVAQLELAT